MIVADPDDLRIADHRKATHPDRRIRLAGLRGGPVLVRDLVTHHAGSSPMLNRIWRNPPIFPPGRMPWNAPDFHPAEITGAGAIATARSVARLYGCLARDGQLGGVRLLSSKTVQLGTQTPGFGRDERSGADVQQWRPADPEHRGVKG